jgi:hypothetical protein
VPANVIVTEVLALNPEPVNRTDVPTGPLFGTAAMVLIRIL